MPFGRLRRERISGSGRWTIVRHALLLALTLLVAYGAAACGEAPAATTVTTTASTSPTTTEATTVAPDTIPGSIAPTTTVAPVTTTTVPRVRPEGRDAPDFTLALSEGGSFTLSEEHRPVFLLFWAEW